MADSMSELPQIVPQHKMKQVPTPSKTIQRRLPRPKQAKHQAISTGATKSSNKKIKNAVPAKKLVSKNVGAKKLVKRKKAIAVKAPKPMPAKQRAALKQAFVKGIAGKVSTYDLMRAGVFSYYPLKGGTFERSSQIKAIVVHSTETAHEASAKEIIRSWNNSGRNHAGTQFIIDRDGVIYQTVIDPVVATFHVNSFITKEGVKNDNSIGIEIVRTGEQTYTQAQTASIARLVHYLRDHFSIDEIFGHGEIQPADRTDPVNFNWTTFDHNLDLLEDNLIAHNREMTILAAKKKFTSKKIATDVTLRTKKPSGIS